MKFFKQTIKGSCNIIAIQHVLSFFDFYPTFKEIQNNLPQHQFGNWLTEIGTYFENLGYKTKLISNHVKFVLTNDPYVKTLEQYKKVGKFEGRFPTETDIKNTPVLINVDAFKIRKEQGGSGAHYVVLVRDGMNYHFYDGNNFDHKVSTTFSEIYKTSLNINDFHENGMWLIVEGRH